MTISRWWIRLVSWDGLLPLAVWYIPQCIEIFFPGRRGAIEIASLVVPVMAVLIRYYTGMELIRNNHCSKRFRIVQKAIFCIGILMLVMVDCVLILMHVMPKNPNGGNSDDLTLILSFFGFYLIIMGCGDVSWSPVATRLSHLGTGRK